MKGRIILEPAKFGRVSDQSINLILTFGQQMFNQAAADKACSSSDQDNHGLILN